MNPCFLLGNPEQTPLTGGARVGVAHRRREAWRLPVRPLEAVLRGRMRRCVRQAPLQPPLGRGPERLHRAVHLKQGDLMVVANAGDSWLVLGIASDNGTVTLSSSSSHEAQPATPTKSHRYSPCRARSTTTISRTMASSWRQT
ncbi:hypothetical protein ZEAMMB73_Zm00001d022329 [Zea mays]|uniref:Uncharacterized protein n=1 Tax=Zea mays TaxID=4577 RepID=A0A1D6IL49_MAIZE|nr:hypothetical protein ZEAMMB73_Zm00001d022329 [Zea mays]